MNYPTEKRNLLRNPEKLTQKLQLLQLLTTVFERVSAMRVKQHEDITTGEYQGKN